MTEPPFLFILYLSRDKEEEMNAWNLGDQVTVQVPQQDGTFDTFTGVVVEVKENGLVEVSPSKPNAGNIDCKSEWLYPEGWLS